ncbi:MAG: bifunctional phosphoglucose/phosphomannose isomerase [Dehalococcoidia bacterium]|nr:bifunctional phosphoglucose/phosphomannose isomerase [Dehalococcoidia bacterium]
MDSTLDNPGTYGKYDPSGSRRLISALPDQCRKAWQDGLDLSLPATYRSISEIIIIGMGGSAIGGDLLRSLTLDISPIPITVSRDYALPKHADANTLVIASSYSGNTEETLSAFAEAMERGCKTIAMTSGGQLAQTATLKGIPFFEITYKGPPRSAVGYGLFPALAALQNLGIIPPMGQQVDDAANLLGEMAATIDETVPEESNQAKQVARRLVGAIPIIYGAGILSEVAHRWKTQINENSKGWAFYELLPELHHNTATGYLFPTAAKTQAVVVMLHAASLHHRVSLRYQITEEVLKNSGIPYLLIEARGETPLSQMLSTVLLGDYVSLYLAMLNEVDPTPVPTIDYIKSRLE